MTFVWIVAELLFLFLFPVFIIFLTKRVPFFHSIGAVTLCYLSGFILSVLPIPYDKELSQTVASVLVALAIPLILFGFEIMSIRKLAKKTLISFGLVIFSVISVSVIAAFIASSFGMENTAAFAGMSTGLYIGGTPNMFAIGSALLSDISLINLANIADSVVGGIYFMLVLTLVKKLYRLFLKGKSDKMPTFLEPSTQEGMPTDEYDYRSIPRDKKSLLKLGAVILLAALCLGIGVLVEILVNGNMEGSLYIMVTVSILGILVSFIRPVREVKGSYQIGQYFILTFSLGLSMSIDFAKLVSGILPTLLFFCGVQFLAILVHFFLCKLFHIDGGTALITSIAGIYGPPFIAPTANAYGDRGLLVPGVLCGTLGLVIGNLLGLAVGSVLGLFI